MTTASTGKNQYFFYSNIRNYFGILTEFLINSDWKSKWLRQVSLSLQNVAFRGTKLMNTEFVYGCALYTGADTKMSQNSKKNPTKFSSIEVKMNKYLIVFLILTILRI